jgi:glycosyltransferase involved in cell wall biosynthesis
MDWSEGRTQLPDPTLPGDSKVTIAIPTLNRVEYLKLALESALDQTYNNIEVIVSNNASTDATSSYLASCRDPRLRVIEQTRLVPMTENWNACVAAATGKYFLLLSDDDLLDPDAIQELVAGYANQDGYPEPGFVYCGGRIIDSAGREVPLIFRPSPSREAARGFIAAYFGGKRGLYFCGVLQRTADLLPGFPPGFAVASDAAAWMRSSMRHGTVVFIPKQLVSYRVHQSLNFATDIGAWKAEFTQLYELAIALDKSTGNSDPTFPRRLRSSIRRGYLGMIVSRINEPLRAHKARALIEYGRHLPSFLSPSGLLPLSKGIVTLFLSERSNLWLRQQLLKRTTSFRDRQL